MKLVRINKMCMHGMLITVCMSKHLSDAFPVHSGL